MQERMLASFLCSLPSSSHKARSSLLLKLQKKRKHSVILSTLMNFLYVQSNDQLSMDKYARPFWVIQAKVTKFDRERLSKVIGYNFFGDMFLCQQSLDM